MSAYYNEIDAYAAQWLRNLIAAGHIAPGDVDERSIAEVTPKDVEGYTQCHFFAGIGGWSYALRLAGWGDSRPVWTGSCPCQPFSAAGAKKADEDDRHLAPAWLRLIAECRPSVVFGEQVDAAIGVGWLDALFTELEAHQYACGAASFNAASVGAPHIRQRLYFVGDAEHAGSPGGVRGRENPQREIEHGHAGRGSTTDFWSDLIWLPCRDGKARPTQPGLQPLAHGIQNRVGRLRAYGNAIVPQAAAEFIAAYMECRP